MVGPVVVDFSGSVAQVGDLCSYALLKTQSFSFVAQFRDRLRTDLGFIHQLHLSFTDNKGKTTSYTIGPGHRVQLGDLPVDFGPQTGVPSFELNGVSWMTIKVPFNGAMVVAAYDGSAAVSFSAFPDQLQDPMDTFPFEGLCADVGKMKEQRDQQHSAQSCDEVQEQPDDKSIDCTARTARSVTRKDVEQSWFKTVLVLV